MRWEVFAFYVNVVGELTSITYFFSAFKRTEIELMCSALLFADDAVISLLQKATKKKFTLL
jgi:hypothetical protein